MATILQMTEALINAHNAGDEASARRLAAAIKERKSKLGSEKPIDPTEGMSTLDKFVAGYGKATMDAVRGVGQLVGAVSREDVDESRRLDAPLMKHGAATAGNVINNIAMLTPAALIPGVNSIVGAGVAGAGMGAIQPVGKDDSRIGNAVQGAALNALFPALSFAGKAVKAGAVDPFRQAGQEAIAGRVLQRFAKDPANVTANQMGPRVLQTLPTLAESSGDEGIAQLQRVLMTQNPQAASKLAARESSNNAVRIAVLSDIAGDASKREFFETARETAAEKLYGEAFRKGVNAKQWAKVEGRVKDLMKRPVMQEAREAAKKLAADRGIDLDKAGSVQGLHWMKKAMDDMLDSAPQTGIGNARKAGIADVRNELIGIIDKVSPKYGKARATFEEMSKPINQMDVGQRLLDKTTSALRDFSGNPKLYGESFARAMRDEAGTAAKATGFKGATLESVMSAPQMAKLRAIESELSAFASAREAGKVSGSPTAQYLVGQDLLRQSAGPLGIPKTWLENQFAQNFGARPTSWAYKVPEEKILGILGDAMLDPQIASALLAKANRPGPLQKLLASSPGARRALEASAAVAQVAPLGLLSPTER